MATAAGRKAAWVLATCFAGGAAAGHAIARWTTTPPVTAPDEVAADDTRERNGHEPGRREAPAAAPPTTASRPPATPLPSRDLPLTSYYDELAQRARDGDASAARRLADDLYECATRERQLDMAERLLDGAQRGRGRRARAAMADDDAMDDAATFADRRLNAAERFVENAIAAEKRCAGIAPDTLSESADWIRQAALSGDPEAQLCYAIAPNEWNRDVLSPQWVDWAERWNGESPALVRRAFESGLPEAAAVLSTMYSPWQPRDARPWSERLGDDPYWAYAYAVVAQQTLSADQSAHWSAVMRTHASRLTAEQVSRADAWAAEARARILFQPPATGPAPDQSLCGNLRRAGSR
ncbi:MAG: hypothetical protein AMXMBFR59_30770 [Rhodanobacteraceae bacterium]